LNKKLTGCCSICDTAVFDIVRVYPVGHPYHGEPLSLGAPLDTAFKLTMLLTSGDHIDITVCSNCIENNKINYNDLWERIKYSWGVEVSDKNCIALNKPVYNEKQKVQLKAWLTRMSNEMILGVMCSRPWKKVKHG